MHPDPLQLCRHYGLPLTKILATPLSVIYLWRFCFQLLQYIYKLIYILLISKAGKNVNIMNIIYG